MKRQIRRGVFETNSSSQHSLCIMRRDEHYTPEEISEDKKELIVTCKCGCQDTIHIKVDDKDKDADYYAIQTYMSGNWYRDQDDTVIRCIGRKLKKIWAIIRNKDYYYSDVLMSRKDFQKYKEYINQF